MILSTYIIFAIAIFIAYLSGSIPMGYLVARMYGIDVTSSGSGRTGGTNVLRAAGPLAAGLTVLGDAFKGMIPVYLLASAGFPPVVTALAGGAAVLGHNYSIFLGFRGGVGAGTATGALGGLSLPIGLLAAAFGIIALWLSGYASLLSTTIAISSLILLTGSAFLGFTPYGYIVFGVGTLILMLYALRGNFARLRAGTERKVGRKTATIAEPS